MDFFVIDTVGAHSGPDSGIKTKVLLPENSFATFNGTVPSVETKQDDEAESDEDEDYGGLPPPGESISKILNANDDEMPSFCGKLKARKKVRSEPAFVEDKRAGTSKGGGRIHRGITEANELNRTDVAAEMKNAVLTPSLEKKESVGHLAMSEKALRKLNRENRAKTKGKNWFDMPAPEITPELRNELQLIKMRSVLDPKKVFGRVEKRKDPKYFEVGTVLESPLEHFNERGVKKVKKQSLVDQLLADAQFQKFNKRKYAEALEKKKKKAYHKAVVKMKKDKKKKK